MFVRTALDAIPSELDCKALPFPLIDLVSLIYLLHGSAIAHVKQAVLNERLSAQPSSCKHKLYPGVSLSSLPSMNAM